MKRLVFVLAMLAAIPQASAGSPFNEPSDATKRKIVVPLIRKLTGCVAHQALGDSDAVTYYRQGQLSDYLGRQLAHCPGEMSALLDLYEGTYGDGTAEQFIKGPYLWDLPRAVLSLIKPQLDAKVADQMQNEENVRQQEANLEAAAKLKQEQDLLSAEKIESERKAVAYKAALDKQDRVNSTQEALAVLRDKFYECADHQLRGLVKSGETADVLANAAMTICGASLSDVQDSALEVAKAKEEAVTGDAADVLRQQIAALVKQRVVADAVQAKAGMGVFSSSTN